MDILIADQFDLTRVGMHSIVEAIPGVPGDEHVIHEADDIDSLNASCRAYLPAVAIVKSSMIEDDLTSALIELLKISPDTHWVLYGRQASRIMLLYVREHPNFSLVLEHCSREEITLCLRHAMKGQQYICNACMQQLFDLENDAAHKNEILTPAECTVLAFMAQGLKVKDIAALQNRSRHTIRAHKRSIFEKLGVTSALDAVMTAYRLKIINPPSYKV